jgi:hypothetical protein
MKTLEKRLDEILTIRRKIRNLGLGVEIVPEIKTVFDHMTEFVKEGVTWSGSVYLDAADKYIDVKLSNRKDCEVTIREPSTSKKVSRRH